MKLRVVLAVVSCSAMLFCLAARAEDRSSRSQVPSSSLRLNPISSDRSISPGHTYVTGSGLKYGYSRSRSYSSRSSSRCSSGKSKSSRRCSTITWGGLCWTNCGRKFCIQPQSYYDRVLIANGFIPGYVADYYHDYRYRNDGARRYTIVGHDPEPPVNIQYNYIVIQPPPGFTEEGHEILKPNKPKEETRKQQDVLYASKLAGLLGSDQKVDESFAIGADFLKRGVYDKAIESFRRAHKKDEEAPLPRLALGVAQLARGDFGYAAESVRAALAKHTDPEKIKLDAWQMFGGPSVYDQRFGQIRAGLRANPKDADLHLLAGFLYFALEDWTRAAEHFGQAEKLDQADAASARMRALAVGNLPKRDRAEGI